MQFKRSQEKRLISCRSLHLYEYTTNRTHEASFFKGRCESRTVSAKKARSTKNYLTRTPPGTATYVLLISTLAVTNNLPAVYTGHETKNATGSSHNSELSPISCEKQNPTRDAVKIQPPPLPQPSNCHHYLPHPCSLDHTPLLKT